MEDVRANLERVRERIVRAAERSGRRAEEVLLVGVSKTVPAERVQVAVAAGLPALGENRVQEAARKIALLGRSVPWHLIGHLQTNKVKDALALFEVIQSVDRIPLALELSRRATGPVQVLVEVNLGEEPSKSGFAPAAVMRAVDTVGGLPNLHLRGLMAIPPAGSSVEDARPWFRALRALRDQTGLAELSMGMSADLEAAVEEGATIVRVGTAIFGPRTGRP
jgi:pyridoxal phosphate enzyme (YggS family)